MYSGGEESGHLRQRRNGRQRRGDEMSWEVSLRGTNKSEVSGLRDVQGDETDAVMDDVFLTLRQRRDLRRTRAVRVRDETICDFRRTGRGRWWARARDQRAFGEKLILTACA